RTEIPPRQQCSRPVHSPARNRLPVLDSAIALCGRARVPPGFPHPSSFQYSTGVDALRTADARRQCLCGRLPVLVGSESGVEPVTLLCHVAQEGVGQKSRSICCREPMATGDEPGGPFHIDVAQRTTGERSETET